jgi:hypothetical protein
MQLKALQAFSYSCDGVRLEQYEAGQIIDTEDDGLIRVSTEEGWAAPAAVDAPKPTKTTRRKAKE